jgi:hypothetical protein
MIIAFIHRFLGRGSIPEKTKEFYRDEGDEGDEERRLNHNPLQRTRRGEYTKFTKA